MLRPYEKYKPIPELWITQIPSNWSYRKIKYLFSERSEKGYPHEPLLVASQNMGVVPKDVYGNRTVEAQKDLHLLKLVKVGDFVISLRSFQGGIEYAYYQGIISPAYTVIVPIKEINSGYFRHLAKSRLFIELLQMCVTGIREGQNIDYSKLKNHFIPVPSKEEQEQIVRFLDWKLARINKLIRAKKKQIALLTEHRRTTIDNVIMYGANPKTSRKESGITWLGKIPSHWSIMKLKHICRINASVQSQLENYSLEDYVVFLPMENISSDGEIDCSEKRKLKDVKNGFSSFAKHDVIVAKITPCFENGKGACLDTLETDIGFGTTELIVLRANEKVLPRYLYMITQLQQFRIQGANLMLGSAGQKRVPSSFISNFELGIPSVAEQCEILEYLDVRLAGYDKLFEILSRQIKLLAEYRTRLISDVVTGKVDVRGIDVPDYESIAKVTEDEWSEEEIIEEVEQI